VFLGRGYNDLVLTLDDEAIKNRTMNMSITFSTESWKAGGWVLTMILAAILLNAIMIACWYKKHKVHRNPDNVD
jgi:hypothetical protein